jgi:hypothetical protein
MTSITPTSTSALLHCHHAAILAHEFRLIQKRHGTTCRSYYMLNMFYPEV